MRKIVVIDDDNEYKIKELNEIVYLESNGRKTRTYCSEGKEFIIKKCLSEVEEKLPDNNFFKIHKSIIINVDHLKGINVNTHKTVILHKGIELKIAHRKYKDFMDFVKTRFTIWQ